MESDDENETEKPTLSFAQQLLARRDEETDYISAAFIPPTSVAVESLFSMAVNIWTCRNLAYSRGITNVPLGYRAFWNIFVVQRVLTQHSTNGKDKEK